jgi:hypothetical protein
MWSLHHNSHSCPCAAPDVTQNRGIFFRLARKHDFNANPRSLPANANIPILIQLCLQIRLRHSAIQYSISNQITIQLTMQKQKEQEAWAPRRPALLIHDKDVQHLKIHFQFK